MDFGNIWLVKLPKTASFNLVPLELSFTSQLYTFHAINTGEIIVKEVFRVEDHGPINVQTLGKWSTRFGFQYQSESARYLRNRRTDLGGINFLCAMEHVTFDMMSSSFTTELVKYDHFRIRHTCC